MLIKGMFDVDESARFHLNQLDGLLDELEELNLRDSAHIPVRTGTALERVGVHNPYSQSISQLIDLVFDLQDPILQRMRRRVRQH